MIKKTVITVLFVVGFLYMTLPGPTSISNFPSLKDSLKSDEPGDTYQVPNIAAYFSQFNRAEITKFYREAYQKINWVGFLFSPISLNYPPEYAKQYIRNEQKGTFLEEYVYPLRGSVFVNGYEPVVENEMRNRKSNFIGNHINIKGNYYVSKTTLRFYPSGVFERLLVYLCFWLAIIGMFDLLKRIVKE